MYLWTLPLLHCNGWCFPWTMAANAGTNVCLRKVDVAVLHPDGYVKIKNRVAAA